MRFLLIGSSYSNKVLILGLSPLENQPFEFSLLKDSRFLQMKKIFENLESFLVETTLNPM